MGGIVDALMGMTGPGSVDGGNRDILLNALIAENRWIYMTRLSLSLIMMSFDAIMESLCRRMRSRQQLMGNPSWLFSQREEESH